jgi:hypothetical protein
MCEAGTFSMFFCRFFFYHCFKAKKSLKETTSLLLTSNLFVFISNSQWRMRMEKLRGKNFPVVVVAVDVEMEVAMGGKGGWLDLKRPCTPHF